MKGSLNHRLKAIYADLFTSLHHSAITDLEQSVQIKCYMNQLLSGLEHCHERGILHRDIKGSNLLIDRNGMLKIADFGLGNYFNTGKRHPLTSRVVTLWYRAPELLLGSTDYGRGIDLWSAGCLMAEMFAGRPIMPARTEVICGPLTSFTDVLPPSCLKCNCMCLGVLCGQNSGHKVVQYLSGGIEGLPVNCDRDS